MTFESQVGASLRLCELHCRPQTDRRLQRKCACGGAPGSHGGMRNSANARRLALQRKLAINEPGDRYEQEADLVGRNDNARRDRRPQRDLAR